MAKRGHTEEQILRALHQAEGGARVSDLCQEHGLGEATYYFWKKKYTGLGLSELRETQALSEIIATGSAGIDHGRQRTTAPSSSARQWTQSYQHGVHLDLSGQDSRPRMAGCVEALIDRSPFLPLDVSHEFCRQF